MLRTSMHPDDLDELDIDHPFKLSTSLSAHKEWLDKGGSRDPYQQQPHNSRTNRREFFHGILSPPSPPPKPWYLHPLLPLFCRGHA